MLAVNVTDKGVTTRHAWDVEDRPEALGQYFIEHFGHRLFHDPDDLPLVTTPRYTVASADLHQSNDAYSIYDARVKARSGEGEWVVTRHGTSIVQSEEEMRRRKP